MFANPAILADISGFLAGFVFSSLILLLSSPPKNKTVRDISSYLFEFVVVVYCFILGAFLFSFVDLNLEDKDFERSFLILVIASCVAAFAVAQMYHGLAWLFTIYGVGVTLISKICFVYRAMILVLSLNIIYMISNLSARIEATGSNYISDPRYITLVIPFLVPFVIIIPLKKLKLKIFLYFTKKETIQLVALSTLFISTGMAIYVAIVFGWSLDADMMFSDIGKYVIMYLVGGMFSVFEATLPDFVPSKSDRK